MNGAAFLPPAGRSGRGARTRRLFVGVAAAGALLAACGAPASAPQAKARDKAGQSGQAPIAAPAPEVVTYAAQGPARIADYLELPLQLVIPRLGVQAPVIAVGLTAQGAMDVPQRAHEVGWYEYSPRPGTKGNSVLAGHLDWYGVTGVFRRLAELAGGDAVVVRGADGKERSYAVEWRQEYTVNNAPVNKVFEALERPGLTLITCGGRWNPVTRLYDTRVVVRALR